MRPADAKIPEAAYCFDQFPEYVKLRENLDMLEASGLGNPFFVVHDGPTTDRTIIGGREYINFSSYNYLGMSGDPAVSAAAKAAIDRYGTSASASRLVSGQKKIHVEVGKGDDAIPGHGRHDRVGRAARHERDGDRPFDGPRRPDSSRRAGPQQHRAGMLCFRGRAGGRSLTTTGEAADKLLEQFRHEYRRVLIVIEGVYSMDGDIPDLPAFVEMKKRHKALLMIDEAHSIGVLGATGRGIAEHFSVDRRDVDIWMGTFSKSLGSCGGYISGCKALVEYLRYTAPGFVFAAAMPPSAAGAVLASLRLLEAEPERVARLHENSRLFLALARECGLNTGRSKDSPVVPVILGNSIHCLKLSKAMLARGVNVQPILHPAVEESASRLRYFITARHNQRQLRHTVRAMVEELEKIDSGRSARAESGAAVVG